MPAFLSPFRLGFLASLVLMGLTSCAYVPERVAGVGEAIETREAGGNPWLFVPVGAWITRETVEARALGICERDPCPERLAVGVFEARGAEARALSVVLRDPSTLTRQIEAGNVERRRRVAEANKGVAPELAASRLPKRVAASVSPLRHKALSGFSVEIKRAEGEARAAYGAVLARSVQGRVRFVMVVGERAGAVEAAAKAAADGNL